jgi:sigma-E factor negative regulatory protein RseA
MMTDQIREQMSAFLDGELAPGEADLLVRRMERDVDLRRAFGTYVLVGETLRAPGSPMASPGFAARVSAALDERTAEIPPAAGRTGRAPPVRRWLRPLAAGAVAAGAALAAVLLVRPDAGETIRYAGNAATTDAGTAFPATPVASGALMPVGGASPTPAENQRLVGYLVVHGQYATPIGRRNVWSSALATDPGINRSSFEAAETP